MFLRSCLLATFALSLLVAAAQAERLNQKRDEADLVVIGKVEKVATKKEKYGNDGEMSHYTATVAVEKVEKGKGVKAGETIKVGWFNVTKAPSRPLVGASGHKYAIKEKDEARFWLMKKGKDGWEIIYNPDGVEKLKK